MADYTETASGSIAVHGLTEGSSIIAAGTSATQSGHDFLAGGGEMGALMRRMDWGTTPLGPVHVWSESLRSAVSICLGSRFPIVIYWGPRYVVLYNDAYADILGEKHPWALGRCCDEVWAEIWDVIAPMLDGVTAKGEATWSDDQLLTLGRHGYPEECYFSFSFSPVRGEGNRVDGVFTAVIENTRRVIGERRLRTLRELGAAAAEPKAVEDACRGAAAILASNRADLPFALLYLLTPDGKRADLVATVGVDVGIAASPASFEPDSADLPNGWPLARVFRAREAALVDDVAERFGPLAGGPWAEFPSSALVLPIASPGQDRAAGVLVAGISPRRAMDDDYRSFFELVAGHIATAVAGAQAYEAQRRRAEALAELDRAKTAFFSNVSHEFRTPLTLMLGPLEDILRKPSDEVLPDNRRLLEVVHRNGLRLQRLVNTLLDFSRIEAGRVQVSYEPTDVSAMTADLASNFRSACERAGLRLVTDCPRLEEPLYVDRDMWEKIVLNLLSNAFKFTFDGEIAVSLRSNGDAVELLVRDTGTGIPSDELPHVFERFHRVKDARGRTQEGTGIGLALVLELVKLHGGQIRVESVLNQGTTFVVTIPQGSSHLPQDRIAVPRTQASTALGATPFVEEALRWLPDDEASVTTPQRFELGIAESDIDDYASHRTGTKVRRARILWADDNADMRDYVGRLLSAEYEVESVPDGRAALAAAQARRPDLVLTDVMMPHMDGFQLLRELKADPATRSIPVVMLSARAGEESRIEGLQAGADDYIVKPFSARELMARVDARLELHQLSTRLDDERAAIGHLFAQAPVPIAVLRGPELVFDVANEAYLEVVRRRDIVGKPILEALPELKSQGFGDLLRNVLKTGVPHVGKERLLKLQREGRLEDTYWTFIYAPLRGDGHGNDGVVAICNEVTEQVLARRTLETMAAQLTAELTDRRRAEEALRRSEQRHRSIFESAGVSIWEEDFSAVADAIEKLKASGVRDFRRYCADHPEFVQHAISLVKIVDVNHATLSMFEAGTKRNLLTSLHEIFLPETREVFIEEMVAIAEGKPSIEAETVLRTLGGKRIHVLFTITFPRHPYQFDVGLVTLIDITARKRAEDALRTSETELSSELSTMRRMQQLSTRLVQADAFSTLLNEILDGAIENTGADMGNIQLLEAGALKIVAQRGFEAPFLDFFNQVHDGLAACGTAMESGTRVIVEDVATSPIFAGTPALDVMLAANARAVQSTPLVNRAGHLLGMFSTHYRSPQRPSERALRVLDVLARLAADLIERANAEQALRESERRVRLALDAGRMGAWEWDIQTNRVIWSPELEAIHGIAPGSFAGTFEAYLHDVHPEDRQFVIDSIRRTVEEGRDHCLEYRLTLPDGEIVWVEGRGRLSYDATGSPSRMVGVCQDITARKETERALRESEQQLRELNRVGTAVASSLDRNNILQTVTDLATELTTAEFGAFFFNDINPQSGEAYLLYTLSGAPKEAFAKFPKPRATALFGPTFRGEAVIRLNDVTKDQRYGQSPPYHGTPPGHLPVRSYLAAPVKARSGEVLGGLFFGHSQVGIFTEQHERLVEGVAAWASMALENARLYADVETAVQARDEFLSMASHELRNPLNAFRLQLVGLQRAAEEGEAMLPKEWVADRIGQATEDVDRLVRLVHTLLDVSRIRAGRLELEPEDLDFGDVVDLVVGRFRDQLKDDQIVINISPAAGRWDRLRLDQIVTNLVSNAIKFGQGKPIELSLTADPDVAYLSVTDHGIGIDSKSQARLFDQFERAVLRRQYGGFGLGLWITKRLVHAMGGHISVDSEPGRGSTFSVVLPRVALSKRADETRHETISDGDRPQSIGAAGTAP